MKKIWKRLLMFGLLLPVIPVFGIPEAGDSDTGGNEDDGKDGGDGKDGKDGAGKDNDGAEGKKDDSTTGSKKDKEQDKLFTQDELDSVISRRLERERKTWEQKIEAEKKKAAMTEADRLKAEKEEAEKKVATVTEKATQRLIKSEVIMQASKLNIIDSEAAFLLLDHTGITVEDDTDEVRGVKKALELLVKSKPYLVKAKDTEQKKTGDDQADDKGGKGHRTMNSLIRRAAGR